MRKLLRASLLVLALCVPAFAGDIPMPPAPQPIVHRTAAQPPDEGDVPPAEADGLTETVLGIIENLVALF